jgi:hypothetical protein
MALQPDEEPGVAEQFLEILSRDADVRKRYIDAGDDEDAVAGLIAEHTGRDVAASNLPGMAKHLSENKADTCAQLADAYPAMNLIIVTQQ